MLLDSERAVYTATMGDMSAGTVFAGHRIEAVAGRGGMGVVYRARQLSLDRTVALKVIAPALTQDGAIRRRFLRESRAAASIDHPNVIPIYYTGEEGEVAFIAMRYVSGDDLRTLVRRERRLEPARAAGIVAQVGAALDAAHAAGLVHRDVKPANVLLGPEDHAYLTDFGLTKHVLSEPGPTRSGHWVGTLDFVAPEQIRGERIDARSDVYALGCLLHYALTGGPPFPREGDEAKLWAHLSETPAPTGISPELDAVIARALAKSPEDRFPSAGDLGRAALAAAGEETRPGGPERMVAVGAAAPVEIETLTAAKPAPERRKRRALPVALVSAAAVLAAAGALLALGGDEDSPRKPTPDPQVKSVSVGGRLNVVAAAGGRIWTGAFLHDELDAVDPASGRRLRRLRPEIGVGVNALTTHGDTLWAAVGRERRLVRLGARSGRRRGVIPLSATPNAVAADSESVWVVVETEDPATDDLLRYDARSGELRERTPVTRGVRRLLRAGGALWLLAGDPARIVRIDIATGKRRKLTLEAENGGDLAAGAGSLWVTLPDVDQLARIDPRTFNVATIAVGRYPVGVSVRGGSVWVANRASSTVSEVDAATGRARREIQVPLNPYEVATDGEAVWVTSLADGKLTRITTRGG